MKKNIKYIALLISGFFMWSMSYSQQGTILADVYYGAPSLGKTGIQALTSADADISYVGPIGIRGMYMLSDKLNLGVDAHFVKAHATWEGTGADLFSTTTYTNTYDVTRVRVLVRLGLQFAQKEHFHMYWANSFGYRNVTRQFTYGDPNQEPESLNSAIPVGLRTALGGRYFFTDNIGANMELGFFGGALFHFGLSGKF